MSLSDKLVSPNAFDGYGPVPDKVNATAKRIAQLRVKFVSQWTPGMENPLTTREVEELFNAAALGAEWSRELYEARDALRHEQDRLRDALREIVALWDSGYPYHVIAGTALNIAAVALGDKP